MENATRFFKVGFVLGKPWAWIEKADPAKQTDPNYIDKKDKNKVGIFSINNFCAGQYNNFTL